MCPKYFFKSVNRFPYLKIRYKVQSCRISFADNDKNIVPVDNISNKPLVKSETEGVVESEHNLSNTTNEG